MSDTGLSPQWALLGGILIALVMVAAMLWACRNDERPPGDYE